MSDKPDADGALPDWVESLMPVAWRIHDQDKPAPAVDLGEFEHLLLPIAPTPTVPSVNTPDGLQAIRAIMQPVSSSNIAAAGHDGSSLYVLFHSGGLFRYAGVERSVHAQLIGAESPGRYYHARIKGKFEGERLL